jgi:hypothetical protein
MMIGQQLSLKLLKVLADHADVVEVVKPVPFARGFRHRIRGFESHRRLQLKAPVEVAPSSEAKITTAKAIATRNPIMGSLAVDLKEIRSVQARFL